MKKHVKLLAILIVFALMLPIVPLSALAAVAAVVTSPTLVYNDIYPYIYDGMVSVSVGDWSSGQKWGFVDESGKEVIPAIFDFSSKFFEGRAIIIRGDWDTGHKYGFMDKSGKEVIACQYDMAYDFSEGLAAVAVGDWETGQKWGYVDAAGTLVVPTEYSRADFFSEGLAVVTVGDRDTGYKAGFIDKTGQIIVPPKYDTAYPFSGGLAVVSLDGLWGYVDTAGLEVIPLQYSWVQSFSDGVAIVRTGDWDSGMYYGLIDATGKEVAAPKYNDIYDLYGGVAVVYADNGSNSQKYGYIDSTGKEITQPIYDYAYPFSDSMGMVRNDGKYGYVDKTGKEITSVWYDLARNFSDGVAFVAAGSWDAGYKWSLIDAAGKVVATPDCDYAYQFSDGFAIIEKDGKCGIIDTSGTVIIPYLYSEIQIMSDKLIAVRLDSKWGFVTVSYESAGPLDGAMDSLKNELQLAMDAGLILDSMIGNWQKPMSRLDAASAIVRLIEVSTGKTIDEIAQQNGYTMNPFSDTDDKAATFLRAAGISNGVGGGNYNPTGTFTRADMVTMLGRVAENVFLMGLSGHPLGSSIFSDVPGYADPYVGWAADVGITLGVGGGLFDSTGALQNQHTGAFIYRAYINVF